MIDIHTHILPGTDDGPRLMEESIEILKRAADDGVKVVVATPHVLDTPTVKDRLQVVDTFSSLKQCIIRERINIELVLGAELFISPDLPGWIKADNGLTIKGLNRYILLEFPVQGTPSFTDHTIFEILMMGITPVIAHPERNLGIQADTEKLDILIKKGSLAQLNAGSLLGRYGKKARKTAEKLLSLGLIHMIGSDVHSIAQGVYSLAQGVERAAAIVGRKRARDMVTSVPEGVITGKPINDIV